MLTIAADPRHLGARIGITAVLHTWGSALTHHPHIHMIVPGGGISLDGKRWISSAARLPAAGSCALQAVPAAVPDQGCSHCTPTGRPAFFGDHVGLSDRRAFLRHLAPLERRSGWSTPSRPSRAGSGAGLSVALHPPRRHLEPPADLARRDRRHLPLQRLSTRRRERQRTMTLPGRRVHPALSPACPAEGLPPIRHYGLLASAGRKANIAASASCSRRRMPPETEEPVPPARIRPPPAHAAAVA